MQYAQVTDLRSLAEDWETAKEDGEPTAHYAELCSELGIDPTPEELRHYGDMREPTMIRASDFQLYAQELAEEIGAINPDASWPTSCIDWEQAARELSMDYTSVTFDGDDYYIHA